MSGEYTVFGYNPFFVGFLWVLLEYILLALFGMRVGSPIPEEYADETLNDADIEWRSDFFLNSLSYIPLLGSFVALMVLAPSTFNGSVTSIAIFTILVLFLFLLLRNRMKTGAALPPILRFAHLRCLPNQRVELVVPGIQILSVMFLPAFLITTYIAIGPASVVFTVFAILGIPFVIAVTYDYYLAKSQPYTITKNTH